MYIMLRNLEIKMVFFTFVAINQFALLDKFYIYNAHN